MHLTPYCFVEVTGMTGTGRSVTLGPVLLTRLIRVVLNAINIEGAMTFVSTPNVDLARGGLAGAGRAA